VTSSWFFILQLSQDARSNKHQIHNEEPLYKYLKYGISSVISCATADHNLTW